MRAVAIRDRIKRVSPSAYRIVRSGRLRLGDLLPPRTIAGIPGLVHRNDYMLWPPNPQVVSFYRDAAYRVIGDLRRALQVVGRDLVDVDRWLDFGCGYGRILRYLTSVVDPSRIWAADVIRGAPEFCAQQFGVHALASSRNLAGLDIGEFDFMYSISVLTHLNPVDSVDFLRLVSRTLRVGGLALFTVHGECVLAHLAEAGLSAGIVSQRPTIVAELDDIGMSYVPRQHARAADVAVPQRAIGRRTDPS